MTLGDAVSANYRAEYRTAFRQGYDVGLVTERNRLGEEDAQLRQRLQAAESALRLLLASYDLHATEDEDLCHHLRAPMDAARRVLEHGAEPPADQRLGEHVANAICTRCHRPLVVPQVLDHIETPTGWVCMPCIDRFSATVGTETDQGGDLPQTPS